MSARRQRRVGPQDAAGVGGRRGSDELKTKVYLATDIVSFVYNMSQHVKKTHGLSVKDI